MKTCWVLASLLLAAPTVATAADVPISADAAAAMKGESITYVTRDNAGFTAMTADKAAFGMLGAIAMLAEGKKVLTQYSFVDPSPDVSAALAEGLSSQYGATLVKPVHIAKKTNYAEISASAENARYVLDVTTFWWGFGYFPTDWTHYRVDYRAFVELYDVKTKKVIGKTTCVAPTDPKDSAPNYGQLFADNGKVIREKLADGGKACIAKIGTEVFGMTAKSGEPAVIAASIATSPPVEAAAQPAPADAGAASPGPLPN